MIRRVVKPAVPVLALFLWAGTATAIVNIEGQRHHDNAPEGLSGSIGITVDGASGNTDKNNIGIKGRAQWQHTHVTELLLFSQNYGEANNRRNTNKAFLHARHIEQLNPQKAVECFAQVEKNEFSRLSIRSLLGFGMRFTLSEDLSQGTHLGLGAFYSREALEAKTGLTDNGRTELGRFNTYIAHHQTINEHLSLSSTTYYQPAIEDTSDYRLTEEASLSVKLVSSLTLKLALDISHDNQPPQSVEKTDISYTSGIEYLF